MRRDVAEHPKADGADASIRVHGREDAENGEREHAGNERRVAGEEEEHGHTTERTRGEESEKREGNRDGCRGSEPAAE